MNNLLHHWSLNCAKHLHTYSRNHDDEHTSNPGQKQSRSTCLLPPNPVHCKAANQIRRELHSPWKQPVKTALWLKVCHATDTVIFNLGDQNNQRMSEQWRKLQGIHRRPWDPGIEKTDVLFFYCCFKGRKVIKGVLHPKFLSATCA